MQLVVGRIGRAHGVRGELFVEPLTDEPEKRFAVGAILNTSTSGALTVSETKWHSGRFIVHFLGIDNRTKAEQLKNQDLQIDVDPLEMPENPDEFYDHQLIGMKVIFDGEEIGLVQEVIHLPTQDLLEIHRENQSEVLVPFILQFVPDVDVVGRTLVITPPPGLLDETAAIEIRSDENEN